MLARLDELNAPAYSAVNREGSVLRVEDPTGEKVGIIEKVMVTVSEMGYVAEAADHMDEEVPRWYSASEIVDLSAEEARILAGRWAHEIRDQGLMPSTGDLQTILEGVLLHAFRRAAESGIVQLDAGELERALGATGEEDFGPLREWLIRKLGGGQHLRTE